MNVARAAEMLLGILFNDPDAYSIRSIAAKQLTCQRNRLTPERRELLFSALVASLSHTSYTFVGAVADALGEFTDRRALPASNERLQFLQMLIWFSAEDRLRKQ